MPLSASQRSTVVGADAAIDKCSHCVFVVRWMHLEIRALFVLGPNGCYAPLRLIWPEKLITSSLALDQPSHHFFFFFFANMSISPSVQSHNPLEVFTSLAFFLMIALWGSSGHMQQQWIVAFTACGQKTGF